MSSRFRCGAKITTATLAATTFVLVGGQIQRADAATIAPGHNSGCIRQSGGILDYECPVMPQPAEAGRRIHTEQAPRSDHQSSYERRDTRVDADRYDDSDRPVGSSRHAAVVHPASRPQEHPVTQSRPARPHEVSPAHTGPVHTTERAPDAAPAKPANAPTTQTVTPAEQPAAAPADKPAQAPVAEAPAHQPAQAPAKADAPAAPAKPANTPTTQSVTPAAAPAAKTPDQAPAAPAKPTATDSDAVAHHPAAEPRVEAQGRPVDEPAARTHATAAHQVAPRHQVAPHRRVEAGYHEEAPRAAAKRLPRTGG